MEESLRKKEALVRFYTIMLFMAAAIMAVCMFGSVEAEAATVKKVSDVTATVKSTTSVKISWDEVSGADGYKVYRKTGKNGSWKKIKTTDATSYKDTDRTVGKTYYYRVRAYKKSSSGTTYGKYSSSVKFNAGTPAKVSSLTLSSGSTSSISLSWKKVSGADGYQIYRKVKGGEWEKVKTIKSGSTTSWKNTGLSSNTKYYYKVRAYNKASGSTYKGKCSAAKGKTTKARTITAAASGYGTTLSVAQKESSDIYISYTNSGAYTLQFSSAHNTSVQLIMTDGSTSDKTTFTNTYTLYPGNTGVISSSFGSVSGTIAQIKIYNIAFYSSSGTFLGYMDCTLNVTYSD